MNREIEARNEKLDHINWDGETVAVLYLNGSKACLPNASKTLSHIMKFLDLPDHPESSAKSLNIDPGCINEILKIENPTPEQEAKLTAALSENTATSLGSVRARTIKFSLGPTLMVAALADAQTIDQIFTRRVLFIADLPLN